MAWVKRKHSAASLISSVNRYLINAKTRSNHKWVWGTSKHQVKNRRNNLTIINISEIKPNKHPLLKLDKNPYLLENKPYFDNRLITKSESRFRKAIYRKFLHICPICEESLHNGEPVELHHIIPVKDGGRYTMDNIQPLHQMCHQSITHSKMTTVQDKL